MANQITINIGAAANDGTGDPLRTAFNDVNLNFANVWNTGLPNSNIQFSDNRILTVNTNANLVLAPNGVGVVQANVDILPSINRGQSLGSTSKKWNTVNAYYINADVANVASFGNLTIGVANLHITGGSNGYVLQTDGAGNLTWTAQTGGGGNGTPGGANTQIQFNDAGNFGGHPGFTFNSVTHLITVPGNIIPGGNATQSLGNSTHQWKDLWVSNNTIYMNSVPISLTTGNTLTVNGADVVTVSTNANATANIGNFVFNANSLQNLNGGSFNNGDLTHGSTSGLNVAPNGSGAAEFYNTYGNILVETGNAGTVTKTWNFDITGNLTLPSNTSSINYANGAPYGGTTGTGVVGFDQYNIYNTQGGGIIISNFNYLTAEAETAYVNIPAGNSPGDLQIVQEQGNVTINANSSAVWSFNADKSFRLPNNSNIVIADNTVTQINSVATANGAINLRTFDATGNIGASTYFDGASGSLDFYSYNYTTDNSYNWRFDNGGSFTLPNAPGNVYFGEVENQPVIIPGFNAITLNANRNDTAQDYITVSQTGIDLFSVHPININNSTTELLNTDINITSGDDIFLRGRNKPNDSESEGGDINIYAGQGADAVAEGFDTGGGGDIQIGGGVGGSDTGGGFGASSGGFVSIYGGDGGTSSTTNVGSGGTVSITAGSAGSTGNTQLGGYGGSVNIEAGRTTRTNENGGTVEITAGQASGDGTGIAGYVAINIPTSATTFGGSWIFTGTGKTLNVPADSEIYGANFGNFTVGCAGNTIVTSSDYGANVKNWIFGYTGNLLAPGNIITPTNFVGTSLRTNLSDFNWSEAITNITLGTTTTITLANNVFGDPWTGQVTITDVTGTTEANATWWYEAVDSNQFVLYTDSTLSTLVDSSTWTAYVSGGVATTVDYGNISINAQTITLRVDHGDYNNRTWQFNQTGQTVFPYQDVARGDNPSGNITGYALVMGDGTGEAIISTPNGNATYQSSQRLVINPGKGAVGTAGEGGDIYLWAGRGGDQGGSGGDIKIRGGQGGASNGAGGYIRMEGGDGDSAGGAPGFIEITGGVGGVGQIGGYVRIMGGQGATYGGDANISGGTGQSGPGGPVNIIGGVSGNGLAEYGNVNIISGASTWTFDNTGVLTVPGEGVIQSLNDTVILQSKDTGTGNASWARLGTTGGLYFETTAYPLGWLNFTNSSGNANISSPSGSINIDSANGTAGAAGKDINITAGDADQGDFYTTAGGAVNIQGGMGAFNDGGGGGPGGNVNLVAGTSADPAGHTGNINITSGTHTWTFDYNGALVVPGISTGSGQGEIVEIQGTRNKVGITNDANYGYAATFTGTTPALVYTASSNLVQSAKVTFVVQSNNATFGWEQFDVSVIILYSGGVGVTVSNRMNNNPANGDTQVTASVNGGGQIEIYLAQPGSGTAYVNYTATEFNLMRD